MRDSEENQDSALFSRSENGELGKNEGLRPFFSEKKWGAVLVFSPQAKWGAVPVFPKEGI